MNFLLRWLLGAGQPPAITGTLAAVAKRGTASLAGNYSVPGVYLGTLSAVARRGTASLGGSYAAPSLTGTLKTVARRGSAACTASYWPPGGSSAAPAYYYLRFISPPRK